MNIRATFFTIQKAIPLLNNGASIIMTGSVAAVKVVPHLSVYGAAKAALRSLVRSLSFELKDRGIRANLLTPGPVDTPPIAGFPKELALRRMMRRASFFCVRTREPILRGLFLT